MQKQGVICRLVISLFYLVVFLVLCKFFSGSWQFLLDSDNSYNMLFVSGALLLIFGTYLAEPYFTKPLDVLTNSTAIVLALLSIREPQKFVGYHFLLVVSIGILFLSIFIIILHALNKKSSIEQALFLLVTKFGSSKIAFSAVYLCTIFSYLKKAPVDFVFFLTFWIIFISNFFTEWIVSLVMSIYQRFQVREQYEYIGDAIGCENPFLYKIEIDFSIYKGGRVRKGDIILFSETSLEGIVGLVVDVKYLVKKQWLSVYILHQQEKCLKISSSLKNCSYTSDIHHISKKTYRLNLSELSKIQQKEIENNELYKKRNLFVGYVIEGSDINQIKFLPILDERDNNYAKLREGTIVTAEICGQETLFQIIEGKTSKEVLESHNISGFIVGIARKLGKYDNLSRQIDTVKWLPNMYAPLFLREDRVKTEKIAELKKVIGFLPETDIKIEIKDVDSLVTHNTAILGILGIGKSCLTFELIKKVIDNTGIKVVCIDITNEYQAELPRYIEKDIIQCDTMSSFHKLAASAEYISANNDINKCGNIELYKTEIKEDLLHFLFSSSTCPEEWSPNSQKRIRIYNPDLHKITKGDKVGYKVFTTQLTQTEKVRIICEELYKILMKFSATTKGRVLLVFEEAHSLIPEWNSTANPADSGAVNGTAKIILQGRKYGLGSFVITQRTANISKSILNQCNTIFSLRVFDDTGKMFLENYIGSDYANLLPTLEERHAIAVGKALKLRLPVMIRLNNRENIISKK